MPKNSIVNSILANPLFYWSYQRLVGGDRARRLFIENHVRPRKEDKLLDLGCGPGNILDFLPNLDYHGFDVEPQYIKAAKDKYGNRGTFICADAESFEVSEPHSFDLAIATGVIHHLDDAQADNLFRIAASALKSSGRLVTFDGCYMPGQHPISKLMLKSDRGKFVRTREAYLQLAQKHFSSIDAVIDESYFKIPYTSIIMECKNEH